MSKIEQVLTSIEVAQMVGKDHKYLMRDIRNYSTEMTGAEISPVEFWTESTYSDSKGQIRPCYSVTKKGCEFIAHKLSGKKGTEFTAKYINRFHEMEQELTVPNATEIPIGEIASYLKAIDRAAVRQNTPPY